MDFYGISRHTCPAGSRFLYKDSEGSIVDEHVVEWSPSGFFVNLKTSGWRSQLELSSMELLEVLSFPCEDALDRYGVPFTFNKEETG